MDRGSLACPVCSPLAGASSAEESTVSGLHVHNPITASGSSACLLSLDFFSHEEKGNQKGRKPCILLRQTKNQTQKVSLGLSAHLHLKSSGWAQDDVP